MPASTARYGAVFVDACRQPSIPFDLVTGEFFAPMRAHLRPGGVVIVKVGHLPGADALEKAVSATLHAVCAVVMRDRVHDTNSLVIASAEPLSGARIIAAAASGELSLDLVPLAGELGARLAPALPGLADLHRRLGAGRVAHRPLDPALRGRHSLSLAPLLLMSPAGEPKTYAGRALAAGARTEPARRHSCGS